MRIRLINSHMFIECDLLCASYNTSFKGFYFEGRFKPEVMFIQVDDGLTHKGHKVNQEKVARK